MLRGLLRHPSPESMASVRVSVIGALNGEQLLPEKAFDCAGCVQSVRAALGHRPSRPVKLLLKGEQVQDDFVAAEGATLQFAAVVSPGLAEEERIALLQKLRDARGEWQSQAIFQGFSDAAKDDAAVVRAAVQRFGCCLADASAACRGDRALVLEAVRQSGWTLQHAGKACREDRDIVLEAVRQDGLSLQFAGEACRNDREIVLAALWQNGASLEFAGEACRDDAQILQILDLREADVWSGV